MKFRDLNSGGGKNFLKLKSGESVRGVFRGEIHEFRQHWNEGRGQVCPGRDSCNLCKAGEKSAFRFRVNVIIQENGAYVAKVFEQGRTVYEAMRALHEGDYNLEKHMMKISRIGTGTDTVYNIVPVPNGEVKKDLEAMLKAVPLNVLNLPPQEKSDEEDDEEGPAL